MKNCTDCKYAKWHRTKTTGRLHPSGSGICEYPWKMPKLPASMYWIGIGTPAPCGGSISRRTYLKDHCPYYMRRGIA